MAGTGAATVTPGWLHSPNSRASRMVRSQAHRRQRMARPEMIVSKPLVPGHMHGAGHPTTTRLRPCQFAASPGQAPILSGSPSDSGFPGPDQPGRLPPLPRREPGSGGVPAAPLLRIPPGIAEPVRAPQMRRSLPIPVRLAARARARPRADRPGPYWRTADQLTASGPGTGVFAGSPRTRRAPACARPAPPLADWHHARARPWPVPARRGDERPPRIALTASRCSFTCRSIGLTQPVSVLRHPHKQAAK